MWWTLDMEGGRHPVYHPKVEAAMRLADKLRMFIPGPPSPGEETSSNSQVDSQQ